MTRGNTHLKSNGRRLCNYLMWPGHSTSFCPLCLFRLWSDICWILPLMMSWSHTIVSKISASDDIWHPQWPISPPQKIDSWTIFLAYIQLMIVPYPDLMTSSQGTSWLLLTNNRFSTRKICRQRIRWQELGPNGLVPSTSCSVYDNEETCNTSKQPTLVFWSVSSTFEVSDFLLKTIV